MNTFIYNETPTGLVNGTNKTFNTINNISVLEEFFVGGVPYRNINSIGTNTIILNEAPPTGAIISIDYWKI